jgi:hypothetical protein
MSEVKVNKISPRTACGTTTLGDSGDTFTIPAGVSITNSGTASGFGSTGEVSWVTTKKTTTFTVTSGEGYFCDTSSGGFTVNLPAGTAGNSFAVADYTNTFQTGNLTIAANGSQKIGGVAEDATLSTEGQSAYFVYVDDTEGWKNVIDSTSNIVGAPPFIVASGGTETTSGDFKIHTFTGPGTFTVSSIAACAADNVVSHLVLAGGAGGGSSANNGSGGGGGGAGGYREVVSPSSPYTGSPLNGYPSAPNRITVTATAFPITVGAGGTTTAGNNRGTSGSDSVFSTITSAGGGAGGSKTSCCSSKYSLAGGSGGGGVADSGSNAGAAGNTPPVSPSQGNNGGPNGAPGNTDQGGGGGGAGGVGGTAATPAPGSGGLGGAGTTSEINASPVARAGGGGGGNYSPGPQGTATAGGGNGTRNTAGGSGTANTGGGGGGVGSAGAGSLAAGAGGSGVVIIRYKFQ